MKNSFLIALFSSAFIFTACNASTPSATSSSATSQQNPATTTQKKGNTVKTGKIVKLGDKFFIQETGKQPAEIDSYNINLSSYLNQTVKITGEYSGDTLFVGKIE